MWKVTVERDENGRETIYVENEDNSFRCKTLHNANELLSAIEKYAIDEEVDWDVNDVT